jgi:hypothetical protein
MGCAGSVPEPEPEPEPVKAPVRASISDEERAAINARLSRMADEPEREKPKPFKYGDKTTHKVQRRAANTEEEQAEKDAINAKIQEKKAPKKMARGISFRAPTMRSLTRSRSRSPKLERQKTGSSMGSGFFRSLTRGRSRRSNDGSDTSGSSRSLTRSITRRIWGDSSRTNLTSGSSRKDLGGVVAALTYEDRHPDEEEVEEKWRPSHGEPEPDDHGGTEGNGEASPSMKKKTTKFAESIDDADMQA